MRTSACSPGRPRIVARKEPDRTAKNEMRTHARFRMLETVREYALEQARAAAEIAELSPPPRARTS